MSHTVIIALASLIALGMIAATVLTVWQGWLQLRLRELDRTADVPSGLARIELADLRERLRQLEAIAAGVDL